jgi:RNA polymerase sigma-70 factor, ECF subfamily
MFPVSGTEQRLGELEALYREAFERFLRVSLAIVGDRGLALDAVQEGFARAIRGVSSFRGRGSLDGWVWRIVVNEALLARRRSIAETPREHVEPSSNGQPHDLDAGLRAALALLPERQRVAIFLRYYADLDYSAIADALGVRVGTVSATLNAAHARVRQLLQEVQG